MGAVLALEKVKRTDEGEIFMTDKDRTFTVASDAAIVELIQNAKSRLVMIGPAFSSAVAKVLAKRMTELDQIDVRIVMDADAEVYRLGYGDPAALTIIRQAAAKNLLDLREQAGVRIGVVISDDRTMVYAPISQNVETASIDAEKPNAIILNGPVTDKLTIAAGASREDKAPLPEIGNIALDAAKADDIEKDLERTPPVKFDVSRRVNVFHSRVVYVEFGIKGIAVSRRQVPLPEDINTVSNTELQLQITSRLRAPMDKIGPVMLKVGEGDVKKIPIDENWVRKERKRIEDRYTFQVANYGRVILREDMKEFKNEIEKFRNTLVTYHSELKKLLEEREKEFCSNFVEEFLPKWREAPPEYMTRRGNKTDDASLSDELNNRAKEVFNEMLVFSPPSLRIVEKNISPTNVEDERFLKALKNSMLKQRVKPEIIATLFSTSGAAPIAECHQKT